MSITVVGSVLIDIAVKHPQGFELFTEKGKKYFSIQYGSKMEVHKIEVHEGGSGHNVADDLTKLGYKVNFVGKVGSDSFGRQILSNFRNDGLSTKNLKVVRAGKTGFAVIFLMADGEKSIMVYTGTNLDLYPSDIPKEDIKNSDWLVFTSVTGINSLRFLRESIRIAKQNKVGILANPSIRMISLRKEAVTEFMRSSDIAIMNEDEIRELTATNDIASSMRKLHRLGAKLVVVTLGTKGAVAYNGTKFYRDKGVKVKVLDSTGCGDSFTAGFLHYIIKRKTIPEALKLANKRAAMQCTRIGFQALSERESLGFRGKH